MFFKTLGVGRPGTYLGPPALHFAIVKAADAEMLTKSSSGLFDSISPEGLNRGRSENIGARPAGPFSATGRTEILGLSTGPSLGSRHCPPKSFGRNHRAAAPNAAPD